MLGKKDNNKGSDSSVYKKNKVNKPKLSNVRAGYLAGDSFKVRRNSRNQKSSHFESYPSSIGGSCERHKDFIAPSSSTKRGFERKKKRKPKESVTNKGKGLAPLAEQPQEFGTLMRGRFKLVFVAYGIFAFLLSVFVLKATLFDATALKEQAETTRTTEQVKLAKRGTIYDRNGKILAATTIKYNIVADPTLVNNVDYETKLLNKVIGKDENGIRTALTAPYTIGSTVAKEVCIPRGRIVDFLRERGDLCGVFTEETRYRQYPFCEVGGQVIGMCGADGKGVCGLEYYYDAILRGTDGYYKAELSEDKALAIPGSISEDIAAKDGQDIVISLDINLQSEMEYEVENYDQKPKGADGSAISIDAQTGEIYACCGQPFFNPADPANASNSSTRVRCITDTFEPGSIFKPITALAALEAGTTDQDKVYHCPAKLSVDDRAIKDSKDRGAVDYTLTDILKYSSNIGISLVAQEMGYNVLNQKIKDYEVIKGIDIDYPGAGRGMVDDVDNWYRHKAMNISFGQGIIATPLQMLRFYSALSNNGYACNPHFLISRIDTNDPDIRNQNTSKSEQLITNQTAINQLDATLHEVVVGGSGKNANISGYYICGKTGTAEYVNESTGSYESNLYNVSFIGFMPNTQTNIVTYTGVYSVADSVNTSSLYKKITEHAIELYSIPRNE
ncbi:MAG: penicillin-binding protein 2 [Eggerthellaceae bacterium]|nr:penicillin-binding protein 2 [Eggerthellaceae bacterium]